MPKVAPEQLRGVLKAAYLSQYVMEAVGFTEFIFEESIQTGVAALKICAKQRDISNFIYMRNRLKNDVLFPGLKFHKQYGPLNPFTYPGFECFYTKVLQDIDAIGIGIKG